MVLDGGLAFKQFKWVATHLTPSPILGAGQLRALWPVFPR